MSERASSWYLWLYGLASASIRGSAHVAMVILTGTGVAQMIDSAGVSKAATGTPLTFYYFSLSVIIGGAIKAFAYLEEKPLPALPALPLKDGTNPPTP